VLVSASDAIVGFTALTTCSSCEYREDCEWREMKAKEAQEKHIKRNKPRQREGAGRFGFDTT
jgi:hypothetical protein